MAHRSMYHVKCSNGSSLLKAEQQENNLKNDHTFNQSAHKRDTVA